MNGEKWIVSFLISFIIFIILYPLIWIDSNNFKLLNIKEGDIVYFGDSVLGSTAQCENNHSRIDEILNKKGLKVINIDQAGFSPIIYQNYIKNIPKNTTAIIPINIATFAEKYSIHIPVQFLEKRIASSILSLDTDSIFNLLYEKLKLSDDTFNNNIVIRDGKPLGTHTDIRNKTRIKKNIYCEEKDFYTNSKYKNKLIINYMYHYMFDLNRDHIMFDYIKNIISYAKDNNIKLLFYITPSNVEYGNYFVGERFGKIFNRNVKVVKDFFEQNNVDLIDMSNEVAGENFFDHELVTEHIDYTGRKLVADKIYSYLTKDNKSINK